MFKQSILLILAVFLGGVVVCFCASNAVIPLAPEEIEATTNIEDWDAAMYLSEGEGYELLTLQLAGPDGIFDTIDDKFSTRKRLK